MKNCEAIIWFLMLKKRDPKIRDISQGHTRNCAILRSNRPKYDNFGPNRRSRLMHAKTYGSVLFSATETASKPYLVIGFCQKIDRFEMID